MIEGNNLALTGLSKLPVATLDGFTPEQLATLKRPGDYLTGLFHYKLRVKAGQALPLQPIRAFQKTPGETMAFVNHSASTYQATLTDTNMAQANRLPEGHELIIKQVMAEIQTLGGDRTSETDPTIATADSGASNMRTIREVTYIKLFIGGKHYDEGPIGAFPAEFGVSGYAGAGAAANYESVANNGFGKARSIVPQTVDQRREFGIDVLFTRAAVPTQDFDIDLWIVGLLRRPIQ